MARFRGTDTEPGWVNRELREIKRQIREMRAEKRLAGSSLAEGQSLLVRGILQVVGLLDLTGTLSMKNADGAEMIRMGDMTYGRGLEFKRSDGTSAFELRKAFSTSTKETWALRDISGNAVVSDSGLSHGLSRPYLTQVFQPYAATSGTAVMCGPYGFERTTTSATFETLFRADTKVQNPFLDLRLAVMCSDATTAGEVQVVDLATGNPIPGYLAPAWVGAIPAGTTTMTVIESGASAIYAASLVAAPGNTARIALQVRRTAGTGSITVAIPRATG